MILVEAHHPNGPWWSLTPTQNPDEVARAQRWYRAQLEGLDGARVEVIEHNGREEQLLQRETFTDNGWTEGTP
jgi:hypothetical protein